MKPLKKSVSVTLDTDVVEKVKEASEWVSRSFSQYVNLVLKEHFENKDIHKDIRE